MELIENLLQLLVTFVGALLSGISYRKSRRQAYFLLLCFYGCFALGALYWTLYLLLFDTTPKVFYVSEFGWVASVIFLRILQATLAGADEHSFRCRDVYKRQQYSTWVYKNQEAYGELKIWRGKEKAGQGFGQQDGKIHISDVYKRQGDYTDDTGDYTEE